MADYNSSYTGAQIDNAVGKALAPDAAPTADSANLVTSGGVKTELDKRVESRTLTKAQYDALPAADKAKDILYNIIDDESSENYQPIITANGVLQGNGGGGISARAVDVTPTASSTNLITSGAVKSAIDAVSFPSSYTNEASTSLSALSNATFTTVFQSSSLPAGTYLVYLQLNLPAETSGQISIGSTRGDGIYVTSQFAASATGKNMSVCGVIKKTAAGTIDLGAIASASGITPTRAVIRTIRLY